MIFCTLCITVSSPYDKGLDKESVAIEESGFDSGGVAMQGVKPELLHSSLDLRHLRFLTFRLQRFLLDWRAVRDLLLALLLNIKTFRYMCICIQLQDAFIMYYAHSGGFSPLENGLFDTTAYTARCMYYVLCTQWQIQST